MTDQTERYDRIAKGYAQWWAPVLAPGVDGLLGRLAPVIDRGATNLVDVGTGTGQLAIGAVRRWPHISVVGLDPSAGMCAMAEAVADEQLDPGQRRRFTTEVAFADSQPFDDASFEVAASSFVLQLVPNRSRALREIRRVLRPGGVFESVTWLADGRVFVPDEIFDDLLDEIGVGARESDGRSGDFESPERAGRELRRAGFRDVSVEAGLLEHRFTVEGYVEFLVEFDEETLIAELDPEDRSRLLDGLRTRLDELPPDDLAIHFPIVHATAHR